jgi:hypothetical protein
MITLEKDIERKLREMVERRGGKCLKWVCPGWSGVPDRIVLLPGGRCVFVETKRPKGGVLSKLQEKWKQWLTDLGFYCTVVWDEEDLRFFEAFLRSYDIEREERET